MASKADFQSLVDWCTQPSTSPHVKHSVGVHLRWDSPDDPHAPERFWEGNLTYVPAGASRFMPEHFSGVVRLSSVSALAPPNLHLAFALGDHFAVVGLGAYDEYDVDSVADSGGGVLRAQFGPYNAYLFNSVSWAAPF
jgi:hypothetical protein